MVPPIVPPVVPPLPTRPYRRFTPHGHGATSYSPHNGASYSPQTASSCEAVQRGYLDRPSSSRSPAMSLDSGCGSTNNLSGKKSKL